MPSPIVTADLIASSARLAGVLADGETLSASEFNDSLLVLNDLLENWSTETLSVWSTQNEAFNTVAGQATYTVGNGGDFNTGRPPLGVLGAYVTLGTDNPLDVIGQQQYDLLPIKYEQGLPEKLLYVGDYPLGRITLWRVPSEAMPLVLTLGRALASPVALATSLSGPPGYLKALRYCLGVELCAEFGMRASAELMAIAADAKGDYKRANQQSMLPVAGYDSALLGGGVTNWRTGY